MHSATAVCLALQGGKQVSVAQPASSKNLMSETEISSLKKCVQYFHFPELVQQTIASKGVGEASVCQAESMHARCRNGLGNICCQGD